MDSTVYSLTQLLLCEYRIVYQEHVKKQVWFHEDGYVKLNMTVNEAYEVWTNNINMSVLDYSLKCANDLLRLSKYFHLWTRQIHASRANCSWVSLETEQLLPLEFPWNSYRSFTLLSKSQLCKYYSKSKTKQQNRMTKKTDKTRKANQHNPEIIYLKTSHFIRLSFIRKWK